MPNEHSEHAERNVPPDIFQVATGTSEPIYQQLIAQCRRLVAAGQLRADDALPSVREVASVLGVNPMTVSKAYSMLEAEGVLVRRRGVGMAVAAHSQPDAGGERRLELLRPGLERLANEARQLELDHAAVLALFQQILRNQTP